MKTTVTLLLLLSLFSVNTFAQESPQWHLPAGAKARLGKGTINQIIYSPDGNRLAVASGTGIWIYDAHTGKALDLLAGHTGVVNSVAFSPGWSNAGKWE
jgi:WD40 repeat protein